MLALTYTEVVEVGRGVVVGVKDIDVVGRVLGVVGVREVDVMGEYLGYLEVVASERCERCRGQEVDKDG